MFVCQSVSYFNASSFGWLVGWLVLCDMSRRGYGRKAVS